MKLQRSGWLVVALLVVGARANAQITYTMTTSTFLCDAASYRSITQFEGSSCRGIPMEDSKRDPVGSAYIFSGLREGMSLPGVPYDPYGSITKWVYSTQSTFQFEWEQDGHTGTATGTWRSALVCGNRCWYHPELLTFTVTVN